MKTRLAPKIIILATLMAIFDAAAQWASADEPKVYPIRNIISFTDDGSTSKFIGLEEYYYLYYQTRHEPVPELNQNWGETVDGLKLSIGFRRHEFLKNEPAMLMIILRNLDSRPRSIMLNDYSYKIELSSGTNMMLYYKTKPIGLSAKEDPGQFFGKISGKSEILIVANLSRIFELNHWGTNTVQVQIQVAASDGMGVTNIASGEASFQIVEKLSASELAARKMYDNRISEFRRFLEDHGTNSPVKSK